MSSRWRASARRQHKTPVCGCADWWPRVRARAITTVGFSTAKQCRMLRSSHRNHARFISLYSSKFPFLNRRPSSRRLKPRNSDQWAGVIAPKAALIEATNDLFPLRSDAIEFERTCSLIDSFAKQTYQTVGELLSQDYLLLSPRSVLPHAYVYCCSGTLAGSSCSTEEILIKFEIGFCAQSPTSRSEPSIARCLTKRRR